MYNRKFDSNFKAREGNFRGIFLMFRGLLLLIAIRMWRVRWPSSAQHNETKI